MTSIVEEPKPIPTVLRDRWRWVRAVAAVAAVLLLANLFFVKSDVLYVAGMTLSLVPPFMYWRLRRLATSQTRVEVRRERLPRPDPRDHSWRDAE